MKDSRYLEGFAGINMLQRCQRLRREHWDSMQLTAAQADVASIQSLPTCLQADNTGECSQSTAIFSPNG